MQPGAVGVDDAVTPKHAGGGHGEIVTWVVRDVNENAEDAGRREYALPRRGQISVCSIPSVKARSDCLFESSATPDDVPGTGRRIRRSIC